jgi:hypothetical protein
MTRFTAFAIAIATCLALAAPAAARDVVWTGPISENTPGIIPSM